MVLEHLSSLEARVNDLTQIVETIAAATMPPMVVDVPHVSQATPDTLNCTMGNWRGVPTGYAYQWQRDGTTPVGDGTDTYVCSAPDAGTSITCVVTATNANGSTVAPPSNAIAVPEAPAAAA
jgi:hypothetical protein